MSLHERPDTPSVAVPAPGKPYSERKRDSARPVLSPPAVGRAASPAPPRPTPARATPQTSRRDAQFRAAEILGRMMDFFEEAEACSDAARRMACTLLGAEVDRWHEAGTGDTGHGRFRGAVVAAAVALVEAHTGNGAGAGHLDESHRSWSAPRSERDLDRSFLEAGRIHLRVHRILDLAAPHFGRVSPRQEGGVAHVLAHLLEGAVPQVWSAERQSFARCVVEYMGGRG